jgi:hypothetical protein
MIGCLGPQASDQLPEVATIYPSSEGVPALESVPALEQKLLQNQGFKAGLIPLRMGFVDGDPAPYWDFGPGTTHLAPVYVLVTNIAQDGSGFTQLPDHPVLFGVIPGQFGYTPLWQVVLVPITSAYAQERITSVEALQSARDEGLLGNFVDLPAAIDCPIVHRDSRLEEPDGERLPKIAYWGGYEVAYFDLGFAAIDAENFSGTHDDYYTLRREGGEPLDEGVRGVDMNGDGDLLDTNHVFTSLAGDPAYTPMVRATEVVVTGETISVDTPDVPPDVQGISDLFDDDDAPLTDRVVALYPTTTLRYLPRALREVIDTPDTPATPRPPPAAEADVITGSDGDLDSEQVGDSQPSQDAAPGPLPDGDAE